jgi:hypothetical protein
MVETRDDASVVASVSLADVLTSDPGAVTAVCREAVGLLGIRTGGATRMARAVAEGADGLRYEVVLGERPSPAELGHAFAALSVACRIAAREAAVLRRDEAVARAYVAQWKRAFQHQRGGET